MVQASGAGQQGRSVQVLVPVVEMELALLKMEQEGVPVHPPEPRKPSLGVAPATLDAVDVVAADPSAAELIGTVIDRQMLLTPHVDQAIVSTPAVGIDDSVERDFPLDRGLKNNFRPVEDELGVHLVIAFVDPEHGCLLARPSSGLALDPPGPEVALINLDGPAEEAFELAGFGHALTQAGQQAVDSVAVETGQLCDLHGGEISGDMPEKPAKSGFRDSRTDDIAVSHGKPSLSRLPGKAQLVMTQMW